MVLKLFRSKNDVAVTMGAEPARSYLGIAKRSLQNLPDPSWTFPRYLYSR